MTTEEYKAIRNAHGPESPEAQAAADSLRDEKFPGWRGETYNYGATPESVIRERAVQFTIRGPLGAMPVEMDPAHLVTVLGALFESTPTYTVKVNGSYYKMDSEQAQLRTQMLAALGIEES